MTARKRASHESGEVGRRSRSLTTTTALTPDSDLEGGITLTAQNGIITINAPTGTPNEFQKLQLRILAATAAGAITWNAIYSNRGGIALPTTTVLSKYQHLGFEYNVALVKWMLIAYSLEP